MIKIKLNIKKFIPYILFFIVFFSLSSFVMIALKKRIEKKINDHVRSLMLSHSNGWNTTMFARKKVATEGTKYINKLVTEND